VLIPLGKLINPVDFRETGEGRIVFSGRLLVACLKKGADPLRSINNRWKTTNFSKGAAPFFWQAASGQAEDRLLL
jgi:hypothetical protein